MRRLIVTRAFPGGSEAIDLCRSGKRAAADALDEKAASGRML
jgi:hypothetical protein